MAVKFSPQTMLIAMSIRSTLETVQFLSFVVDVTFQAVDRSLRES